MKNYIEFCKEQTGKLFQIIDQHGDLLKWQKTWQVKGCFRLPRSKNGFYQGINLWKLLHEQVDSGYGSESWLTFNQIKEQGGHVLKGAKGTKVCFFKLKEEEMKEDSDYPKKIPLFRAYTVFNLHQTSLGSVDGNTLAQSPYKLQQLLAALGTKISEFGSRAYFSPSDDAIVMPKREHFNNESDYDVTLLHELVHWTGHCSRLDRATILNYGKSEKARAEEELIAEIGSVFLAAHFGIAGDLVNHASYVASWKKNLDAKAVGRAISQASKTFIWLVNRLEQETQTAA